MSESHSHHHQYHQHAHDHSSLTGSRLIWTIVLNIMITVAQIFGGLISGSLALLSDALHNFSDVMALIITYAANRVAQRKANTYQTFGYKRVELLAALFNAAVLAGIGTLLIFEAVDKFFHPQPVESYWVIGLAILSIILNWASVILIAGDAEHNSNIKAAYLHLTSDIMTSIAVLIGGLGMMFFHFYWLDPLVTVIIAAYLIIASWGLIKQTSGALLLFAPSHIKAEDIVAEVKTFEMIENIHHVHIWQLDDHEVHLEAHLDFKADLPLSEVTNIVIELEKHLHKTCDINHFNFQTEFGRDDCKDLIN